MHASAQDLKYCNSTIQADLDRFQRQKVADLREMCINMARTHRDWCKKVWKQKDNFFVCLFHALMPPLRIWKNGKV